jgi:hypothetical protein
MSRSRFRSARPRPAFHARAAAAVAGALALVLPADRAEAQGAPVPRVRVVGVVYDSLLRAPLAGATVTHAGTPAVAFTDSTGRFSLTDVPAAPGRFVLSHPGLDSAGLPDVPLAVDLSPDARAAAVERVGGDSAVVRLATPSLATLRARVCGAASPARGTPPGLVFGEVFDAASGDRLAGARAAVTWTRVDTTARPLAVHPERRDAVSDALGGWAACGLPLGTALEARAAARTGASGRAAFAVGPRGIARLDLWVPPESEGNDPIADAVAVADTTAPAARPDTVRSAPGVPAPAFPAPVGTAPPVAPPATNAAQAAPARARALGRLVGTVRDTTGAPRQGVLVTADAVPGRVARTGLDGTFRLDSLPLGSTTLVVRAIGFPPQSLPVAVRPGTPVPLDITLRGVVTLAGVTVRAERVAVRSYALDALDRRRRFNPLGVLDSTTIHRYTTMRTALQQSQHGMVRQVNGKVGLASMDGGCLYGVALDGRPSSWEDVLELPPDYVLAVETYPRRRWPAQFEHLGSACGLALVWTRTAR